MAKSYFYDENIADWRELVKGEQGEQGPVGPEGPQGPQGEQGPMGTLELIGGDNPAITVDTSVGTRVFVGDTMIHGDTGWRDISELLNENWRVGSTAHTRLHIRRENNTVYMVGRIVYVETGESHDKDGSTHILSESLPSGFRPYWIYQPLGAVAFYGGESFSGASDHGVAYQIVRPAIRMPGMSGTWSPGQAVGFSWSWNTTGSWPSTLPGTPR